jgi:hypothetical protein
MIYDGIVSAPRTAVVVLVVMLACVCFDDGAGCTRYVKARVLKRHGKFSVLHGEPKQRNGFAPCWLPGA